MMRNFRRTVRMSGQPSSDLRRGNLRRRTVRRDRLWPFDENTSLAMAAIVLAYLGFLVGFMAGRT